MIRVHKLTDYKWENWRGLPIYDEMREFVEDIYVRVAMKVAFLLGVDNIYLSGIISKVDRNDVVFEPGTAVAIMNIECRPLYVDIEEIMDKNGIRWEVDDDLYHIKDETWDNRVIRFIDSVVWGLDGYAKKNGRIPKSMRFARVRNTKEMSDMMRDEKEDIISKWEGKLPHNRLSLEYLGADGITIKMGYRPKSLKKGMPIHK